MTPSPAPVRQYVCMKWGTKYPAADVNRLYQAVRASTPGEMRFYCLTDDPAGIDPSVTVHPIPDLPIRLGGAERGWRKLALFSPAFTAIQGPTLFLDLDMIIVGSLAPFFEVGQDFHVIKDYKRFRYRNSYTGNTSVFLFIGGQDYGVYRGLSDKGPAVAQEFRNEQEFLSNVMRGLGKLRYWPQGWCPSYKYHCIPSFPMSLWQEPRLPPEAKVLVFHGHPKPEEAVAGKGNKWYRPTRAAPWLAKYL